MRKLFLSIVNCQLLIAKKNSGQVVLLLVLITVVGLTIGLSLISRTVTDVRISSQIEQSGRAFSAAESGVETALKSINIGLVNPTGSVNVSGNGATANFTVNTLGNSGSVFTTPLIGTNTSVTIWLVSHKADRTLDIPESPPGPVLATDSFDICWNTDPNVDSAVELTLYYISASEYRVAKLAFDNDLTRGNNFYSPDSAGNYCDGTFRFKKTLIARRSDPNGFNIPNNPTPILLALRIQPLYNNTKLAIKPNGFILPIQGEIITSIGQSNTGVVRKMQVINGFKTLPTILDFALFSEN